jgi:hypothetical protein
MTDDNRRYELEKMGVSGVELSWRMKEPCPHCAADLTNVLWCDIEAHLSGTCKLSATEARS